MPQFSKSAFAFGPELGSRLKGLRGRRGRKPPWLRSHGRARRVPAIRNLQSAISNACGCTAPKLHDEASARVMAELAAETFEQWRIKLPPKPPAASR